MNPFQKNKVDVSALSPEEQKAFRLYGKLPNRKDVLQNKLKERKYFDSGDYALSKAGKTSEISPTDVGREHPVPENIPHLSSSPGSNSGSLERSSSISSSTNPMTPATNTNTSAGAGNNTDGLTSITVGNNTTGLGQQTSGSPVKESSLLSRETSIDDDGQEVHADHRRESNVGIPGVNSESISPPPQRQGVPIRGPRGS